MLLCFSRVKQDWMLHVCDLHVCQALKTRRAIGPYFFFFISRFSSFPISSFLGDSAPLVTPCLSFLSHSRLNKAKGDKTWPHYLSLWTVCLCFITLAQTRTSFFFKMKITVPACPPRFCFYSIVDCNSKLWQVRHLLLSGLSLPSNEQPSARKCRHHL